MTFVFGALQIGEFVLLSVLLFLLLRGHLRNHPVLFAYNLSLLVLSLLDMVLFRRAQRQTPLYFNLYWTSEMVWDILLFALAAVLIQRVLAERPERAFAQKIILIV